MRRALTVGPPSAGARHGGRRISAKALGIFRAELDAADGCRERLAERLTAACAAHPADEAAMLREEVLALLAAEAEESPFLESPPLHIDAGELLREVQAAQSEAAAMLVDPSPARMGRRIGQFTLLRRIGSGGAGTVYEAQQDVSHRRVALKVQRVAGASPVALARFLDEAAILGRLRHRAIAMVHAAGIETDAPDGDGAGGEQLAYIAMELVPEARSIVDHCASGRLELRTRLYLFLEVCDAVQHAHQLGVIHRDLKPDNVLVAPDGSPKVVDFGIARLMDSDPEAQRRTQSWQMLGTIGYTAPEHLAFGDSDARGDVYSLGTILYELLCGRPAHDLRSRGLGEALRIACEEPIAPPSSLDRRIPRDLSAIAMQALAREPAARYQSVATLTEDLRRFLACQPVAARPPGVLRSLGLFARRHRALAASIGLAASVAASALALAALHWRRAVLARHESITLQETQEQAVRSLVRQVGADGERLLAGFLFAPLTPEERERFEGVVLCSIPRPDGSPAPLVVADADGTPLHQDDLHITIPEWVSKQAAGLLPFRVVDACVAEVDPTNPGRELLVMLRPDGGSRAQGELSLLRICDLALRPIREAWTGGQLTSMVWNQRAGLLVITIEAIWLQYFAPELAAFDAAHCHPKPPNATAIVALSPSAITGVILPPDGPFTALTEWVAPGAETRWAMCRAPLELRAPRAGQGMGTIRVELADSGSDDETVCVVVESFLAAGPPDPRVGPRRPTVRRVPLGVTGRLLARGDFDFFRDRLRPLDLEAMRAGKPVADAAIVACRGIVGVEEAIHSARGLDPIARRGALLRVAALQSNWRWLNLVADGAAMRQRSSPAPGDDLLAVDLARRACALHDSRCPDLEACRVRWFVLDTLGLALFRGGQCEEALEVMRECEARWKRLAAGLQPNAAGEVAVQAMCLDQLGQREEALAALARAEAELTTSEGHGGATAALVAEARSRLLGVD